MNNKLILIVEDDDDDFLIFNRALKKSNCQIPVKRLSSGEEALDYLFQHGDQVNLEHSPLPAIILLDLNMPGIGGRAVLKETKDNEALKKIPIIVLTTSEDQKDIDRCYSDGANGYIVKPASFKGFIEAINCLNGYWFDISVLPNGSLIT